MGRKTKKNKNKIQVLAPGHDFYGAFGVEPPTIEPPPGEPDSTALEPEFNKLLEENLKGRSASAMLRAKKERKIQPSLPLQKRLKRYPAPECELDLHGFNAIGARLQTDSFIRTRWQQGFFTLRLIVGKGRHSESGAVLPDVAEDLLVSLKKEGLVLHYEWEKKKKTQSGAVIVYLKRFTG